MTPRECPRCGKGNIRRPGGGRNRPRTSGSAVMRKRMCMDCGFVGVTSEFWYYGDFLQSHLSPLVGDEGR